MIFELEKIQKNNFLELSENLIPASILITIIAAATSFGTGMYGAGYLNTTASCNVPIFSTKPPSQINHQKSL